MSAPDPDMDQADLELLRERLRRLEWEVRWWRRLGALILVGAILAGMLGMP